MRRPFIFSIGFILLTALTLPGCRLQLISEQDPILINKIISTYESIDNFYLNLLSMPEDERVFDAFQNDYLKIESQLNTISLLSKIKPLNENTTEIVSNIIELWSDSKEAHKEDNSYSNTIISSHRDQYLRVFTDLLMLEKSKPTE